MMAFPLELEKILPRLVAHIWADENLHQRFMSEPATILREVGIMISDSVKIIVNQGYSSAPLFVSAEGGTVYEINLPPKPMDLTEEELIMCLNQPLASVACC